MEKILNELINYFGVHPVNLVNKALEQPIKFLTNTNLL